MSALLTSFAISLASKFLTSKATKDPNADKVDMWISFLVRITPLLEVALDMLAALATRSDNDVDDEIVHYGKLFLQKLQKLK